MSFRSSAGYVCAVGMLALLVCCDRYRDIVGNAQAKLSLEILPSELTSTHLSSDYDDEIISWKITNFFIYEQMQDSHGRRLRSGIYGKKCEHFFLSKPTNTQCIWIRINKWKFSGALSEAL